MSPCVCEQCARTENKHPRSPDRGRGSGIQETSGKGPLGTVFCYSLAHQTASSCELNGRAAIQV